MINALSFYLHVVKRPVILFLLAQAVLRFVYLVIESGEHTFGMGDIARIYGAGLIMDALVASYIAALVVFYRSVKGWGRDGKVDRTFRTVCALFFLTLLFFSFVSDILFWAEFKARFNFIAVDYLVYSKEVVANIRESYNLPVLLGIIFVVAVGALVLHRKTEKPSSIPAPSFFKRVGALSVFLILPILTPFLPVERMVASFDDQIKKEIAQDGWYTFVQAFFQNAIDYDRFYVTTKDLGIDPLKALPAPHHDSSSEKHHNVIFILMESMSAEFMGTFGAKTNETPNLDRFAAEGMLFDRFYATGTRTVRGMEALVLAIPPVPGQAIVRRPDNGNLHSIGFEFQNRGYDTAFVYGGNGYFDNMNEFMGGNGFRIVDRPQFEDKEVHFENAWGLCDEDIFLKVISEADKAHASGKPFMCLALTTSNHRPYTFPEGKIDLPSKTSGRGGGVKYSDFAIGELIRHASTKPWFANTLFVFVADHTAGTTGRLEITPEKHHIPAIIYAPKLIKPQRVSSITSQIDLPVTVMGLLNFKLTKPFYGQDVLHTPANRAFLSHFQKIGYYDGENLLIMKPVKDVTAYRGKDKIEDRIEKEVLLKRAVPFYEAASTWRDTYRRETSRNN